MFFCQVKYQDLLTGQLKWEEVRKEDFLFFSCLLRKASNNTIIVNESDLRSNEHYLSSSSEKKAWKKFRPVRDLSRFIWDQHIDQLPIGLLAQLVEHCTGFAEVMGSNPVQAWIFFQAFFSLLLK